MIFVTRFLYALSPRCFRSLALTMEQLTLLTPYLRARCEIQKGDSQGLRLPYINGNVSRRRTSGVTLERQESRYFYDYIKTSYI